MKILIVVDSGHEALGRALTRQLEQDCERVETVIHAGAAEIAKVLVDTRRFDAAIVCHSHLRELLATVAMRDERTGLVLYSTYETLDGCPEGTVWREKGAESAEPWWRTLQAAESGRFKPWSKTQAEVLARP